MKINTSDFDTQTLRDRILDLAMQGKLVPQDPAEESADLLLSKSRSEKEVLVKDKKIKKSELNYKVLHAKQNLPLGWRETTLKEITTSITLNDGDWILSKNMSNIPEVKLIQLGSIGNGEYIDKGFKYITNKTFNELNCTQVKPGYLLINRLLKNNKLMVTILPQIDGKLITAVDVCWIAPSDFFDQLFMMYQIMNPRFQEQVNKLAAGSTRKRISKGNLINIPIYLPPLAEQKRIADRISQLFDQIDKIESASQQYTELQSSLRTKVLDVAIHGKLVEQNSTDEPASVLLDKIKSEKAELIKEKKIKKSKPLLEITDDEKPFDIPESWEWVRIGDILKPEAHKKPDKNFVYIDIASVDNSINTVTTPTTVNIEKDKVASRARQVLDENDILFSVVRPYLRNIAMVPNTKEYKVGSTGFYVLKPFRPINRKYIFYLVLSNYVVQSMTHKMKGDNSPSIRKGDLQNLVIPLPPLAEQARIVNKIEKVFSSL